LHNLPFAKPTNLTLVHNVSIFTFDFVKNALNCLWFNPRDLIKLTALTTSVSLFKSQRFASYVLLMDNAMILYQFIVEMNCSEYACKADTPYHG
jgi:hypothetical protein